MLLRSGRAGDARPYVQLIGGVNDDTGAIVFAGYMLKRRCSQLASVEYLVVILDLTLNAINTYAITNADKWHSGRDVGKLQGNKSIISGATPGFLGQAWF